MSFASLMTRQKFLYSHESSQFAKAPSPSQDVSFGASNSCRLLNLNRAYSSQVSDCSHRSTDIYCCRTSVSGTAVREVSMAECSDSVDVIKNLTCLVGRRH